MKRNKTNSGRTPDNFLRLLAKLIIFNIIIFLVLFLIISYIWKACRTCGYFKIAQVLTKNADNIDLSYLKGRNIFSLDLKRESGYILDSFPEYANVRIVRIFPERIFADFIKRRPQALIKLYRYFAVDEDGVIFYPQNQPEEADLPVIAGLETKIFGPKSGKRYSIRELALALNIIKEFKSNSILKKYKIKKIDVVNYTSTAVLIQDAGTQFLEVKLGADNIKNKITMLGGLLAAAKKDIGNIKYIDLRFKEPVIKFIDVKPK